ncbi:ATP-binding protein [Nonomuraea sp. NPDC004702]
MTVTSGDTITENLFRGLELPPHHDGCDGYGWANVTTESGHLGAVRCAGCAGEHIATGVIDMIPVRFRKPIDLLPAVADWVARGQQAEGLYLAGNVGTGKTHQAYWAMAAWCFRTLTIPAGARVSENYGVQRRLAPTVKFIRATTLFDELRPSNDNGRQPILDSQEARLLIVDDIGAEKPSEFTCEKLYEIVDQRYADALPLIVTSNVPPRALSEQVGERVASRFAEFCRVVPMTGPDRRKSA